MDANQLPAVQAAAKTLNAWFMTGRTEQECEDAAVSALVAADPHSRMELLADLADELDGMGFPEAAQVLDQGSFWIQEAMTHQTSINRWVHP